MSSKVQHIPCGPFVNESERIALQKIKTGLHGLQAPGYWLLLTNLSFSVNDRRLPDEIDIIILGPTGIFVVEVKHWDTAFIDNHLNAQILETEAEKINSKAKKVKGKLANIASDLFVSGCIFLTKSTEKLFKNNNPLKRGVKGINFYGLNDWKELCCVEKGPLLNESSVAAAGKRLEPKIKIPLDGDLRTLGNVINMECVGQKDNRFHRVYRGMDAFSRDRVIVHLFDLSATEEKKAINLARQGFEALQKLWKYKFTPTIRDSFQIAPNFPGEMYYYSVNDPSVPSLRKRGEDREWTYSQRIAAALNCANALSELHSPTDNSVPGVLHRNLNPDSIRIRGDDEPLFMDLDLSKLPGGTIASQFIAPMGEERYQAPEVRRSGIGAATAQSDIYSLCASLELLFVAEEEGNSEVLNLLRQGTAELPEERIAFADLIAGLKKISGESNRQPSEYMQASAWYEGLVLNFRGHHYKIINRLGSGGIGTTFKVAHIDKSNHNEFGTYVAKVISHEKCGVDALNAYCKVRSHIKHNCLAAIYEFADEWKKDRVMALLDWIEGHPLIDLAGGLPADAEIVQGTPCEETLLGWLADLCDALETLHSHGLVHGDVSPRNIIWRGDDLVLTDYDAVIEVGSRPRFFNPAYCSPTAHSRVMPSDDIFALGLTFCHVLSGVSPEYKDGLGLETDWEALDDFPAIKHFILKAIHVNYEERFKSGAAASSFLRKNPVVEVQRPVTVLGPTEEKRLASLLSVYPGSLIGNNEARGLDTPFAEETYIETALDHKLFEDIRANRVSLVILFGNAGDGKTAFLQHLATKLGLKKHHSSERLWDHILPDGLKIKANLDGSAAYDGKSASELLDSFFEPFQAGQTLSNQVHLLAINSGPLQAWILNYKKRNGSTILTKQLQAMIEGKIQHLDSRYRFIDLNKRSLVGGIDVQAKKISTFFLDELVERLIGKEAWRECPNCTARDRCTAWYSVVMLRDPKKGPLFLERLYSALQAVHIRGEVHITTRELKAACCYIFFGVHYCQDLHKDLLLRPGNYFDRAFSATSPNRQGELLRELSLLDPAHESHPRIDRFLMGYVAMSRSETLHSYPDLTLPSARRRAYFEWHADDISKITNDNSYFGLMQGRYFERFKKIPLLPANELQEERNKLCHGIAKLESLPLLAHRHTSIPIRITPRTPTESVYWVAKPAKDFVLRPLFDNGGDGLEKLHSHVELIYREGQAEEERLMINARLFHTLMELKDGMQLSDAASGDIFANLSIFTERLVQGKSHHYFAWTPLRDGILYGLEIKLNNDRYLISCEQAEKGSC